MSAEPAERPRRGGVRLLRDLLVAALGLAALALIARGLGPASPALAGVLRVLLHPLVLAGLLVLLLLWRVRRRPDP